MFRATDNRCSRIVDEAERKRLEKKSRARMAAVKSPMKITAPKKANKNTKKILERRAREQRLALENFRMLERLKRASAKSTLDMRNKTMKFKKQFKHNKQKIRQMKLEAIVADNFKMVSRLTSVPPTIKEVEFDQDYYDHVHCVSRMREFKTTEGFHSNLVPPEVSPDGSSQSSVTSPGGMAYTWRPKSTAKLREMPPDIFSKPRSSPSARPKTQPHQTRAGSVRGSGIEARQRRSTGFRVPRKKRSSKLTAYETRRRAGEFTPSRDFQKTHFPSSVPQLSTQQPSTT